MSQIDTVRPTSVRVTGTGISAVPSGTLASVTADDSDSTYILWDESADPSNWNLRVGSHTPPANHQRHRVRGRIRARAVSGTSSENIDLGRGSSDFLQWDTVTLNSSFAEYVGSWYQNTAFGLANAGALSDLNIGGGYGDGSEDLQTAECYVDIDCRARPDYSPQVQDGAGVDRSNDVITDAPRATVVFGAVGYDGLPALSWQVSIGAWIQNGSGTPPTSLTSPNLPNGDYNAVFTVRSTIRGSDPFEHQETVPFSIAYTAPPPSPPFNLQVEQVDDGVLVSWEDPGAQPWDNNFAVAEVFRVDCANAGVMGLSLPGVFGSYASTPDGAGLDIEGDIDLRFDGTLTSWRPLNISALVAKHDWRTGDNLSYSLILLPNGQLEMGWSVDGTEATRTVVGSTVTIPYGRARRAVRATLDVDSGGDHVVTFYTADTMAGPWVMLGDPVVLPGTTSIFSGTSDLFVGAVAGGLQYPLQGLVHNVEVYDGINGTLVANPVFASAQPFASSFLDTVERVWNMSGAATVNDQGMIRIAVIPDALTGSYLDRTPPIADNTVVCDHETPCVTTYRVRYWGVVGSTVELPSTLPAELILGWPSTAASIPDGWERVTSLDGRFPRGSSAAVSGATGGAASHSHTTPGHTHGVNAHDHAVGGSTSTSNANTISARFNGASQPQADQPHAHSRPARTGSGGAGTSGSASPATATANNLPAYRDVIWIASDGSQTAYPVGVLGFSSETIDGWDDDPASAGRYLRGAAAAGDGGGTGGANTHTHSVDAHTHTGYNHTHSLGATGLSTPVGVNAGFGSTDPRWLPRHTHPMSVGSASTTNLGSAGGGTTGSATLEPPNRRLRVLQNITGSLQIRIIGLYVGDIDDLPLELSRCDGTNGTPDMRDWFARQAGADNINTTGGSSTHNHSTPTHNHTLGSHAHTTATGASSTGSFQRPSTGDLGNSPTTGHTHTSGNTFSTTAASNAAGSGTTNTVSHIPPYVDAHFVRLDGIASSPAEIPEVLTTAFSSANIPLFASPEGLDRLVGGEQTVYLCTTRSYARPRQGIDTVPLQGGLPSVSTTISGKEFALSITTQGRQELAAVEAVLRNKLVNFQPWGSNGGWFAPSGYKVAPNMRGIKTVTVTLVRQDAPALPNPEDLL